MLDDNGANRRSKGDAASIRSVSVKPPVLPEVADESGQDSALELGLGNHTVRLKFKQQIIAADAAMGQNHRHVG